MNKLKTSETISIETYRALGADGLENLISLERTQLYLDRVRDFCLKDDHILDLACGYGRLTIPLCKEGYHIVGVDLSPELIQSARKRAQEQEVKISFEVGNMKQIPYPDKSFNKVLCLWSSFNHLLTVSEQIEAFQEIYRVLRDSGEALIEMVDSDIPEIKEDLIYKGLGEDKRIHPMKYGAVTMYDYMQTSETLFSLLKNSGIKQYLVGKEQIGGKIRLVVYIRK